MVGLSQILGTDRGRGGYALRPESPPGLSRFPEIWDAPLSLLTLVTFLFMISVDEDSEECDNPYRDDTEDENVIANPAGVWQSPSLMAETASPSARSDMD